jgi:hypothetical protein
LEREQIFARGICDISELETHRPQGHTSQCLFHQRVQTKHRHGKALQIHPALLKGAMGYSIFVNRDKQEKAELLPSILRQ